MITINNIGEIEKYKVKDKTLFCGEVDGVKYVEKEYLYRFTENGKLADVTFNCYIPFTTYDLGNINLENKDNNIDRVDYTFIARDVYISDRFGGGLQNLVARNLFFKGYLEIDVVKVHGIIKGHRIASYKIKAQNIECDSLLVFSQNLKCKKLKTGNLEILDFEFSNIDAQMKDIKKMMKLPF